MKILNKIKCFFKGHEVSVDFTEQLFELIPQGEVYRICQCCGELIEVNYERKEIGNTPVYEYTLSKVEY